MRRFLDRCKAWIVFIQCLCEKRRRREGRRLALPAYWRLCRRGFFPNKAQMYAFPPCGSHRYITDQQMLMTRYIDGDHSVVLSDKFLFELVMKPFVRVPRNHAFIDRGRFVSLDPAVTCLADIRDLLVREGSLIIKPTCGLGGKGVNLLAYDNRHFLINGRTSSWEEILALVGSAGDLVICEYIRQGAFADRLYPRTVNTIRMLSMRRSQGSSFIAAAAFRVGCARSVPVDNISAGGIVCGIELESGALEKAARGFFGYGRFEWIDRHPDTGLCLEGLAIPDWKRIRSRIESVADKFPQLPYIAWDVALRDDDIVVIEGNAWSDVSLFQIYRPLLADARIRDFMKEQGILGK